MALTDVHDLIQFYDVNIHSQIVGSADRKTCGCDQDQHCEWKKFLDVLVTDPAVYGTPYLPALFTLQEVGTVPGKQHVPCENIRDYLNDDLSGQGGATWNSACTHAHGACAIFWRNDTKGFDLEDSMMIPLPDTPTFLIQAVKLGTRTGDRHVGVASIHTDYAHPFGDHARDAAYAQMKNAWGDIHYIVAGDLNETGIGAGQAGLEKVTFEGYTAPRGCHTGRQIDYVFLDRMDVPNSSQDGNQQVIHQTSPTYSDHRGLGVTLYWSV